MCRPSESELAYSLFDDLLYLYAPSTVAIVRGETVGFSRPSEGLLDFWETVEVPRDVVDCFLEQEPNQPLLRTSFQLADRVLLFDSSDFDSTVLAGERFEPNTDHVFAYGWPVLFDDGNRAMLIFGDIFPPGSGLLPTRRIAVFEGSPQGSWELFLFDFAGPYLDPPEGN